MSHFSSRIVSGGQLASSRVAGAINKGLLKPATAFQCVDCGTQAREYDHRDYNFPLSVSPVCRSCNLKRGKAIPKVWDRAELVAHLRKNCKFHIVPWAREFCLAVIDRKVREAEAATGGLITRHEIRPDLYPNFSSGIQTQDSPLSIIPSFSSVRNPSDSVFQTRGIN